MYSMMQIISEFFPSEKKKKCMLFKCESFLLFQAMSFLLEALVLSCSYEHLSRTADKMPTFYFQQFFQAGGLTKAFVARMHVSHYGDFRECTPNGINQVSMPIKLFLWQNTVYEVWAGSTRWQ